MKTLDSSDNQTRKGGDVTGSHDHRLQDTQARFAERYSSQEVPWDDPSPPPEVTEFVPTLKPGKALDLGCGYGRAAIYIASLGWEVDAVDFIQDALEVAKERTKDAGHSVTYHLGSVTDLSFLSGPYDFALDVGCCHILDEDGLGRYGEGLSRLLSPGAYFLVYVRCQSQTPEEEEQFRGLSDGTLEKLFEGEFELEWTERSVTVMDDDTTWPSAWYRFRRL